MGAGDTDGVLDGLEESIGLSALGGLEDSKCIGALDGLADSLSDEDSLETCVGN